MDMQRIDEALKKLDELSVRILGMERPEARIGLSAALRGYVREVRTALVAEPAKAPTEKVL